MPSLSHRLAIFIKKLLQNNSALSALLCFGLSGACLILAKRPGPHAVVDLSYFLIALKQKLIEEVNYDGIAVHFRSRDKWYQTIVSPLLSSKELIAQLNQHQVRVFRNVQQILYTEKQVTLLVFGCGLFCYSFGVFAAHYINSTARRMQVQMTKNSVLFSQIYGLEVAKKQLQQIIDYLTDPLKFKSIGARLRRGVMLYGPPGTGKTLLAKATASESKVEFLYTSSTEFIEVYVGTGPKRVRDLFNRARQMAPSIIFIDEIDSIAYKRRNQNFGNDQVNDSERISTLNQLLAELDGFRENDNIVVIAATNRIAIIDEALMRSGRFDIKIETTLPNQEERAGILRIHLQHKNNEISNEAIQQIAARSTGFSGADMETITNESAYLAIEGSKDVIGDDEIYRAFEKMANEKRRISNQQFPDFLQEQSQ